MRLLLDTHVLLWALQDHPKLSKNTRSIICDTNHEVIQTMKYTLVLYLFGKYGLKKK